MIRNRYLRTGFAIDFVASFPFEAVLGGASGSLAAVNILKLLRVLRLKRRAESFKQVLARARPI